jgi:hypothetical protein
MATAPVLYIFEQGNLFIPCRQLGGPESFNPLAL